jgi:hypothetical protein
MKNGEKDLGFPDPNSQVNPAVRQVLEEAILTYRINHRISSTNLARSIIIGVFSQEISENPVMPTTIKAARTVLQTGLQKRYSFIASANSIIDKMGNGQNAGEKMNNEAWVLGIPSDMVTLARDNLYQADAKPDFSHVQNLLEIRNIRKQLLPIIAEKLLINWFGDLITPSEINRFIQDENKQAMVLRGIITAYMVASQTQEMPFPFFIDDGMLQEMSKITRGDISLAGKRISRTELNNYVADTIVNNQLLQTDLTVDQLKHAEMMFVDYGIQIYRIINSYDRSAVNGKKTSGYWEHKYRLLRGLPFEQFLAEQQFVFDPANLNVALKNKLPHLWQESVQIDNQIVPSRSSIEVGLKLLKVTGSENSNMTQRKLQAAQSAWDLYERVDRDQSTSSRRALVYKLKKYEEKRTDISRKIADKGVINPLSVREYKDAVRRRYDMRIKKISYERTIAEHAEVKVISISDQVSLTAEDKQRMAKSLRVIRSIQFNSLLKSIKYHISSLHKPGIGDLDKLQFTQLYQMKNGLNEEIDTIKNILTSMNDHPENLINPIIIRNSAYLKILLDNWRNELSFLIDNEYRKRQNKTISAIESAIYNHTPLSDQTTRREFIDLIENRKNLLQTTISDLNLAYSLDKFLSINRNSLTENMEMLTDLANISTKGLFSILQENQVYLTGSTGQYQWITPVDYLEAVMLEHVSMRKSLNNLQILINEEANWTISPISDMNKRELVWARQVNGELTNPLFAPINSKPAIYYQDLRVINENLYLIEARMLYQTLIQNIADTTQEVEYWSKEKERYLLWEEANNLERQITQLSKMLDEDENIFLASMNKLNLAVSAKVFFPTTK